MPSMFGKPIYWYQAGQTEKIRKLFEKKENKIKSYNAKVYVETNHAFLKSFSDVAMEAFPDMKLIHLVRNPLKVAKSNLNRFKRIRKIRYPYKYRGDDGENYIKWSLTGKEEIFKTFNYDWRNIVQLTDELKVYQILLLHWIEMENRAMTFLDKYEKHDDCYTLKIPKDLNNAAVLKDMFEFFELELKQEDISLRGRKNKGIKKPTIITDEDRKQLEEIVAKIPSRYLKIFQERPYVDFEWVKMFSSS